MAGGFRPDRLMAMRSPAQGAGGLAAARPWLLEALRQEWPAALPGKVRPITSTIDPAALVEAVSRHRLAILLAPHAEALGLPAEAASWLRQEARRQQRSALHLITTTLELQAALRRAGIRVLLLKGPALAVQTTGLPWTRGRGDVDLLVAPRDLPAAVAVCQDLGYQALPGEFPRDLNAFWGRYARWVGHEIGMRRGRWQWLDLHWALNMVRAPLPDFEVAWRERQEVDLNGTRVPTLSLRHAFLASCAHAAGDQWMDLRNLVDITRLAIALPPGQEQWLRRHRVVRLSCAVAFDATAHPRLLAFTDLRRASCRAAMARARWTQERPPRIIADGAWHPGHWLQTVYERARLSSSPWEWLRVLARYTLTPAALSDPFTGRDRGLRGLLLARCRRLLERLQEGRRPERPPDPHP